MLENEVFKLEQIDVSTKNVPEQIEELDSLIQNSLANNEAAERHSLWKSGKVRLSELEASHADADDAVKKRSRRKKICSQAQKSLSMAWKSKMAFCIIKAFFWSSAETLSSCSFAPHRSGAG